MSPLRTAALTGALALPLAIGGFLLAERRANDGARVFEQVLTFVQDRFVDSIPADSLYERAARGLIRELDDPYSELQSPKERRRFATQSSGRYGGLGMQIEQQEGNIVVVRVFPHTPAEAAGIVQGDRIVVIDTASTHGWTSQHVSDVLIGTIGTKVHVRFARPGLTRPIEQDFTRAEIHIPAVPYALMLADHVGYIPLQTFNETAAAEFREALDGLLGQGAKRIVLDLRGDPGGILDQATAIASLLLREGALIASVRSREGPPQSLWSNGSRHVTDVPLVVLVDGYSASASEIVAGALQDHDRALLVGTRTYGKGLVQRVYGVEDGYAVKLTTGKWYTPSARSIQRARVATLGEEGVAVPAPRDPVAADTSDAGRPRVQSAGGRTLLGGGGITPDVVVRPDTLTSAEQALSATLAPRFPSVRAALYEIALAEKAQVAPDFTVRAAWRDQFYARLQRDSLHVTREQFDGATSLVDRWIGAQVTRVAFGDSAAFRRTIPGDAPLERAIELLVHSTTQQDLFTLAQANPAGTH